MSGGVHEKSQVARLAGLTVATAVVVALPAVVAVVPAAAARRMDLIDRWAPILLLVAWIYVGLAIYVYLLPDRGSVFIVALAGACGAALFAACLGLLLYAPAGHGLVMWLDLGDEVLGGGAALWCLFCWSALALLAITARRAGRS